MAGFVPLSAGFQSFCAVYSSCHFFAKFSSSQSPGSVVLPLLFWFLSVAEASAGLVCSGFSISLMSLPVVLTSDR